MIPIAKQPGIRGKGRGWRHGGISDVVDMYVVIKGLESWEPICAALESWEFPSEPRPAKGVQRASQYVSHVKDRSITWKTPLWRCFRGLYAEGEKVIRHAMVKVAN